MPSAVKSSTWEMSVQTVKIDLHKFPTPVTITFPDRRHTYSYRQFSHIAPVGTPSYLHTQVERQICIRWWCQVFGSYRSKVTEFHLSDLGISKLKHASSLWRELLYQEINYLSHRFFVRYWCSQDQYQNNLTCKSKQIQGKVSSEDEEQVWMNKFVFFKNNIAHLFVANK